MRSSKLILFSLIFLLSFSSFAQAGIFSGNLQTADITQAPKFWGYITQEDFGSYLNFLSGQSSNRFTIFNGRLEYCPLRDIEVYGSLGFPLSTPFTADGTYYLFNLGATWRFREDLALVGDIDFFNYTGQDSGGLTTVLNLNDIGLAFLFSQKMGSFTPYASLGGHSFSLTQSGGAVATPIPQALRLTYALGTKIEVMPRWQVGIEINSASISDTQTITSLTIGVSSFL